MYTGYIYYALTSPEGSENAVEVFHGDATQMSNFIDRDRSKVYDAANGKQDHYLHGYYIYARMPEGSQGKKSQEKLRKKRPKKFDKQLESVKWHLNVYGNTSVDRDPTKLLDALAKDGYLVTAKHEPERVIRMKGSSTEIEVWDECWILELKSKVDVSNERT